MTTAALPSPVVAPQFSPEDLDRICREFRPLADWWSNKIQWAEDDHEDLVQEGMLSLITTLNGYNKSGKTVNDLKAIASVCFSAAMKWWYKKSDRTFQLVDYDNVKIPVDNIEIYFSRMFVEQYLQELARVHGAIAKHIVENLIEAEEKVGLVALQSMEKKRVQREEGARVVGYASPRIQKQHIREAFLLDTKTFDGLMSNIKTFTEDYLCRAPESTSGHTRKGSRRPRSFSSFPTPGSTTLSSASV